MQQKWEPSLLTMTFDFLMSHPFSSSILIAVGILRGLAILRFTDRIGLYCWRKIRRTIANLIGHLTSIPRQDYFGLLYDVSLTFLYCTVLAFFGCVAALLYIRFLLTFYQ